MRFEENIVNGFSFFADFFSNFLMTQGFIEIFFYSFLGFSIFLFIPLFLYQKLLKIIFPFLP